MLQFELVMAKSAAEIFKSTRVKLDLTQEQVAKRAGLNMNTYAKIERGLQVPKFATIKKICRALNLDINDIPEE